MTISPPTLKPISPRAMMTEELETPEVLPEETTGGAPRPSVPSAAIIGARVVTGAVGAGIAAIVLVATGLAPIPTYTAAPASVLVTPVPTAQELVCPGGLLRLGDASGADAQTTTAIGSAAIESDASTGTVETDALEGAAASSASAPRSIRSTPGDVADDETVLLAGGQSQVVSTGEFRGLAAAECAGVSTDTWLAGGSTTVGRTTILTISNPSDVIATVDVAIAGEDGAIEAAGATGIIVQPHAQRVIPLAGLAPDVASPVLHVTSQGGQIVANLQQSTVRGLEAGGVDIIGATARPAKSHTIPGVIISNVEGVGSRVGAAGYDDLTTVLRVFVPGDVDTTATVSIVPELPSEDETVVGASFSFDLEAGIVTDLPIEELSNGSYTVSISADVPTVAALRTATVATAQGADGSVANDFAWLGASTLVRDDTLVAIAAGPSPRLHVANPTAEAIQVSIAALGGVETTLSVPARSSATAPVTAGTTYRLSGFASIYAAVSFTGDGQLAGYGVQPPALTSSDITVYP
jgi:hypothetical protein